MYEYLLQPVTLNKTHQASQVLSVLGAEGWRVVEVAQNGTALYALLERKVFVPEPEPEPELDSSLASQPTPTPAQPHRGRGRPSGSKNKTKPPEA
jgi:hypothetical protein